MAQSLISLFVIHRSRFNQLSIWVYVLFNCINLSFHSCHIIKNLFETWIYFLHNSGCLDYFLNLRLLVNIWFLICLMLLERNFPNYAMTHVKIFYFPFNTYTKYRKNYSALYFTVAHSAEGRPAGLPHCAAVASAGSCVLFVIQLWLFLFQCHEVSLL